MSANTRVTDRLVAAYADDLARIVPMMDVTDLNVFWVRVRNAWTAEQFSEAIDTFRLTGDVSVFAALLSEDLRTPMGYWQDFTHVETRLRRVMDQIGRFPLMKDLKQLGLSGLTSGIHDYHGGLAVVRRRMGVEEVRAARGEWMDRGNVERVLIEVKEQVGRFPTAGDLKRCGYHGLVAAIGSYHGGFPALRESMGLELYAQRHGYWGEFSNVRAVLEELQQKLGRFPTEKDLRAAKRTSVMSAIQKHHGGMAAVCAKMGVEARERPKGYWKVRSHVLNATEELAHRLGHFPTQKEFGQAGLSSVVMAARKYHGGVTTIREELGYVLVVDEDIARHADVLACVLPRLNIEPAALWSVMKAHWTIRDLDAAVATYNDTRSLERFHTLIERASLP
jgi:hypothetical protein